MSEAQAPQDYPALRKAGRAAVIALLGAALVVFRLNLLAMLRESLIPLFALSAVGLLLGVAFPGRRFYACFWAWWLVLAASILRRLATSSVPLASQLFGGALFGYPTPALWFAEGLRLLAYFAALWVGARLGARLRRRGEPG